MTALFMLRYRSEETLVDFSTLVMLLLLLFFIGLAFFVPFLIGLAVGRSRGRRAAMDYLTVQQLRRDV